MACYRPTFTFTLQGVTYQISLYLAVTALQALFLTDSSAGKTDEKCMSQNHEGYISLDLFRLVVFVIYQNLSTQICCFNNLRHFNLLYFEEWKTKKL
jgi:hypothetical protein